MPKTPHKYMATSTSGAAQLQELGKPGSRRRNLWSQRTGYKEKRLHSAVNNGVGNVLMLGAEKPYYCATKLSLASDPFYNVQVYHSRRVLYLLRWNGHGPWTSLVGQ